MTIMNVIFAIAGSAILLYCLWGKETKIIAIIFSIIFAFIFICGPKNPGIYNDFAKGIEFLKSEWVEIGVRTTCYEALAMELLVLLSFITPVYVFSSDETKEIIQVRCLCVIFSILAYIVSLFLGITFPYTLAIPSERIIKKLKEVLA